MTKTKDYLEENNIMEICKHCNSAHILSIDENSDSVMCGNCGTIDYVKEVTEKEYEQILNSDVII